ncbi:serine/threonine-protein phosphatase 7 long form homolog [Lotus japonicus]|uniref:serine/threonine-protein phosphatase 7 long form homolog n=1 Tax=Lotus japonicus TaxID=34305 RepID=UPI0025840E55|nr:serine/threonine-protein phosphatase 7 long form homolog [Lotus japonicus]
MADQGVVKLGPKDQSLLYLQKDGKHVSISSWNEQNRILKVRKYRDFRHFIPEEIVGHLRQAGFYEAALAGSLKLDKVLISTMVERWRPETHTFHMPFGECTITLQDVALHLGLPLMGMLSPELLGVIGGVGPIEIMYVARANMLRLIDTFLLCDHTGSHVPLRYLILLRDFEETAKYSWGSAVLTLLYHELCYATGVERTEIDGCAYLIQLWTWLRIPGTDMIPLQLDPGLPLAARWRNPEEPIKWEKKQIEWWHTKLDDLRSNDFVWMSYSDDVLNALPERCRENMHLWRIVVPMPVPNASSQQNEMHDISLKEKEKQNWVHNMRGFIRLWSERHQRLANKPEVNGHVGPNEEYIIWYDEHSILG